MIRVDAQPTPDGELRRQILSKCVEKSEREWWAARTIEKLEFELNAANSEIERLRKANLQLREGAEEQKQRIKRLEKAEQWIPASTKPEGCERKVLLWIVWPNVREWCDSPEPLIGWWKHGPQCFALGDIENADHLVRYWMEIPDPTEAKEAKP